MTKLEAAVQCPAAG